MRCVLLLALLADVEADVRKLLDPETPMEEREAAAKELARTKEGGKALLDLVDQGKLPAELKATAAFACAASPVEEVMTRGASLLPLPRSKDRVALPPIPRLAAMEGDAERGAKVYRDPKGPNCIACHLIGDEGKQVGPPLTTIGSKLSREQLFESVLTPSASILMGYENWIVRLNSGDVKTGIKVEETEERIALKDNQGEYLDLPIDSIAERKALTLSMMPENITETMSVQDLADVVEYLSRQR